MHNSRIFRHCCRRVSSKGRAMNRWRYSESISSSSPILAYCKCHFWECNFPAKTHFRLSERWMVGGSMGHYFPKGQKVTLPALLLCEVRISISARYFTDNNIHLTQDLFQWSLIWDLEWRARGGQEVERECPRMWRYNIETSSISEKKLSFLVWSFESLSSLRGWA